MKILITGNMGYIGPRVISQLRSAFPGANLVGYDIGYFAACLTNSNMLPEIHLNTQIFGDIRTVDQHLIEKVDAIVHLAAISNDPMGKKYEDITVDVNFKSSVRLARIAKAKGVRSFIFASSCSIYGAAQDHPKKEDSLLEPLTAYAKSKMLTEQELQQLADEHFTVTCLRFATACGMSDRLRLDLVLNDFVAGAVTGGKVTLLSDGNSWRPLIHVHDMARAIEWAILRQPSNGGSFLAINTGKDVWNFKVKDLANAVAHRIPGTVLSIPQNAIEDKRSYRVDFRLFETLAPDHQPMYSLEQAIQDLNEGIKAMDWQDPNFRNSRFVRLKALATLQEKHLLNDSLEWTIKTDVDAILEN